MKNKEIFMIGTLALVLILGLLVTPISQVFAAGGGGSGGGAAGGG